MNHTGSAESLAQSSLMTLLSFYISQLFYYCILPIFSNSDLKPQAAATSHHCKRNKPKTRQDPFNFFVFSFFFYFDTFIPPHTRQVV